MTWLVERLIELRRHVDHLRDIAPRVTGRESHARDLSLHSGATYTLLSEPVWRDLGLSPTWTVAFTLADGTQITRQVSECRLALPQGEAHTPVILGEGGDEPLLGVVTLEILGLVLNPFTRTLQPMRMMLA